MLRRTSRRFLAKTAPKRQQHSTNFGNHASHTNANDPFLYDSRADVSSPLCTMFRGALKVVQYAVTSNTSTNVSSAMNVNSTVVPPKDVPCDNTNKNNNHDEAVKQRHEIAQPIEPAKPHPVVPQRQQEVDPALIATPNLRQSKVPATRVGRAAGFASLFTQIGFKHVFGGSQGKEEGRLLGDDSHELIASTLSRMRGAVMKLGQMLSIQDEGTVPSSVTRIFSIVRDQAYVMPDWQLAKVLETAWGSEWKDKKKFVSFSNDPIAAASFGQVHHAVVHVTPQQQQQHQNQHQPQPQQEKQHVAVKIQFPGVATSIDSDVANLRMLGSLGVVPSGLFVGNILDELKKELQEECNYLREATKQEHYRQLVTATPRLHPHFNVPRVYREHTTKTILTTDFVQGVPIEKVAMDASFSQEQRNALASRMMELTLYELFVWCFMQTDPNFSNFLYDAKSDLIHLLDFGAARSYDLNFVRDYLEVVQGAAVSDRDTIIQKSIALGFLTGQESATMLDAHVASVFALGKPFRQPANQQQGRRHDASLGNFDFQATNIPVEVQSYVPTMLKLRLKPPPTPIYSLHRRLSGTILLCTKLGAKIDSGGLFERIRNESLELHGNASSNAATPNKKI